MPLGRISKLYLKAMKSYIHHVSSRKQMAWSAWVTEESLIKGLFTKMWAAFKETSGKILVPRGSNSRKAPPWLALRDRGVEWLQGFQMMAVWRGTLPGLSWRAQPVPGQLGREVAWVKCPDFSSSVSDLLQVLPIWKCNPSDPPGQESTLTLILICASYTGGMEKPRGSRKDLAQNHVRYLRGKC